MEKFNKRYHFSHHYSWMQDGGFKKAGIPDGESKSVGPGNLNVKTQLETGFREETFHSNC